MTHTFTTLRRSLWRRKGFSAINILGLAVGLAACVLIFLYARNELTFDRFHEHHDRTHLIIKERHLPTGVQELYDTWIPLAPALVERYPEIENAVRVVDRPQAVQVGEQGFQRDMIMADPAFFEMFDFEVAGSMDGASLLADLDNAIVSEETARQLFGNVDPVGRTFRHNDRDYIVGGVLEPFPRNSSYQPQIIVPFESQYDLSDPEVAGDWGGSFLETWIRLAPDVSPAQFEATLDEFIEFQFGTEGPNGRGNMVFRLLALTDLHEWLAGTRTISLSLLVIAAIILVIAVVNFTNLSTASSFHRSREIGMRKVLGAGRGRVMRQFLTESLLISLIAMALAVVIIELVRPWMNGYFDIDLRFPLATDWRVGASLLAFALGVGFLAGLYPAMVLSSFRATRTIKGEITSGRAGAGMRKALLGLQFALAVALLALTAIVWQQIQYMKHANLSMDTESVVALQFDIGSMDVPGAAQGRLLAAKTEIEKLPGVVGAAFGTGVPGDYVGANIFAEPLGYEGDVPYRILVAGAGDGYFDLYDMPFLAGEPFSPDMYEGRGAMKVVLNETCARMMGLLEDGVGAQVNAMGPREVIGIVKDHHIAPLTQEIRPMAYFPFGPQVPYTRYLSIKLAAGNVQATLDAIETAWAGFDDSGTFDFVFVDDHFRSLYASQERIITLAGIFALIGVAIASLGLLGLVSYAVILRTREIGIRKVLGATERHIVALLGRDFLVPVLVANVIAWPAAWYLGRLYLQEFPYRMSPGAGSFALATVLTVALAAITLTATSWRAASRRPTETLRHE